MEKFTDLLAPEIAPIFAIVFVAVGYLVISLRGMAKDDTQVGLKLVLFGLLLACIQLAARGASNFLGFALGGFKGGSAVAKESIPPIMVGGVIGFVIAKLLLVRTNYASQRQIERFFLGTVGAAYGAGAIVVVNDTLTAVFTDAAWRHTAHGLATTGVVGALALYAISRFGALSGWSVPVMAAPPPPPAPPPGNVTPPPIGYGPPPSDGGNPYAPR